MSNEHITRGYLNPRNSNVEKCGNLQPELLKMLEFPTSSLCFLSETVSGRLSKQDPHAERTQLGDGTDREGSPVSYRERRNHQPQIGTRKYKRSAGIRKNFLDPQELPVKKRETENKITNHIGLICNNPCLSWISEGQDTHQKRGIHFSYLWCNLRHVF